MCKISVSEHSWALGFCMGCRQGSLCLRHASAKLRWSDPHSLAGTVPREAKLSFLFLVSRALNPQPLTLNLFAYFVNSLQENPLSLSRLFGTSSEYSQYNLINTPQNPYGISIYCESSPGPQFCAKKHFGFCQDTGSSATA